MLMAKVSKIKIKLWKKNKLEDKINKILINI
jgi:hypothetical protein